VEKLGAAVAGVVGRITVFSAALESRFIVRDIFAVGVGGMSVPRGTMTSVGG
jgi:hypothetical protein